MSSYPFPFSDYEELLLNWQSTYLLNQARYLEVLDKALLSGGDTALKTDRLNRLIRCNGSFTLLKLIEQAKKELSVKEKTALMYPEINLEILLTRDDLKKVIAPFLEEVPVLIDTLLSKSGLDTVDRVVSTGGSSLIPDIREILEKRFPHAVEEWDPFHSIAAGLAMADYNS